MRITRNMRSVFRFPTCLIVNRLTAGIIRRSLNKQGIRLPKKLTKKLIKEFKRYKRHHDEWNLVEIYTPRGDIVDIVNIKL